MPLTGKDLLKLAKKSGWKYIRTNGSHYIVEKNGRKESIPVHGNRDLRKGIEHKLLQKLGIKYFFRKDDLIMKLRPIYPAVFYYEEQGFSVIFPDFDSGTDGKDLEDAMNNAQEFLDSIVAVYLDDNMELPKPSLIDNLPEDPDFEGYKSFKTLFQANPMRFMERKIKINLTIPQFLVTRAKEDNLNISRFVTESLEKKYNNK